MDFAGLAEAGFGPDLLPIIPADAKLSPTADSSSASFRGKAPGQRNQRGVWQGLAGWSTLKANAEHHALWTGWGAGIGLQTRQFPSVDIDVLDPEVSALLAVTAFEMLGPAPARVGRAPKTLLVYRAAPGTSMRKQRLAFTLPGQETVQAVELLGDGQQFVAWGIHPGTLAPYSWQPGVSLMDVGADSLTPITLEQVERYLARAAEIVADFGGAMASVQTTSSGSNNPAPTLASLRGDPAMIREALKILGNEIESYDEWMKMCAAIKAALGGDEEHYGIFEDWCLLDTRNTAELVRKKWDSLRPPYRVGAEHVYRAAADKGWGGFGAAVGFTPLALEAETGDGEEDSDLPAWSKDYAYALEVKRFVHVKTREVLDEQQFARLHSSPGIGPDDKKNPVKLWFQQGTRRKLVHSLTYLPAAGAFVTRAGRRYINAWVEPEGMEAFKERAKTITDADVAPWLELVQHLLPDETARETILNWMAHVAQRPTIKPNWAIFLGGGQGIGKDTLFAPLRRAVGERHSNIVEPEMLTEIYTDWIAEKRLIMVGEIRNFETKKVANRLKLYISAPPDSVPVRKMHTPTYEIPNVAAFVFMSNNRNALTLEQDDRRYFVYWSPAECKPQEYYTYLHDYMRTEGEDAVVAWLMARDISGFNPQGRAPMTLDKLAMQEAGRSDFEQAIIEGVEGCRWPFDGDIATTDVLWANLPMPISRMFGASQRAMLGALRMTGAAFLKNDKGDVRRIDLDSTAERAERARFGLSKIIALRDVARWQQASTKDIRAAFRRHWAQGAMAAIDASGQTTERFSDDEEAEAEGAISDAV